MLTSRLLKIFNKKAVILIDFILVIICSLLVLHFLLAFIYWTLTIAMTSRGFLNIFFYHLIWELGIFIIIVVLRKLIFKRQIENEFKLLRPRLEELDRDKLIEIIRDIEKGKSISIGISIVFIIISITLVIIAAANGWIGVFPASFFAWIIIGLVSLSLAVIFITSGIIFFRKTLKISNDILKTKNSC